MTATVTRARARAGPPNCSLPEALSTGSEFETQRQQRLRCCHKRRAGFARAPFNPAKGQPPVRCVYLTKLSILNIGRYMEITITPTMAPTMIIISGSMIEVSVAIDESTSSS